MMGSLDAEREELAPGFCAGVEVNTTRQTGSTETRAGERNQADRQGPSSRTTAGGSDSLARSHLIRASDPPLALLLHGLASFLH